MRSKKIVSAVALSLMGLGVVGQAAPAFAGETGDTDDTVAESSTSGSGSGSGEASGGVAAGGGGTAVDDSSSAAVWVATGGAGIALLGLTAATRRRRSEA